MRPSEATVRIIWITPKFPLGAPDGARHATSTLIQHLGALHVKVELICVLPDEEYADPLYAQKALGVSSCSLVRRTGPAWRPLLDRQTPYTFRSFAPRETRKAVHRVLSQYLAADHRRQTYVLFDGLHPFACLRDSDLKRLLKNCRGVIYRAHNFETTFWEQCTKTARTPWFRWFYRYQTRLVEAFERHIAESVSWVAPVSDEDAERFTRRTRASFVSVVPIGLDFPSDEEQTPFNLEAPALNLLFLGRLDWIPNKNGLIWFLQSVWPALIKKRPDIRLKIAGVGDGSWLERFSRLPGIACLGRAPFVEPLYTDCALSIAPLFQGSGTRVKILEAARYARPVLSTVLGAEGTGLVPGISFFQAETAPEWIQMLERITPAQCQMMGWTAFQTIRNRFGAHEIAERFLQTLQHLHTPVPGYATPTTVPIPAAALFSHTG